MSENSNKSDEKVVEVSEQELNDLGDFLAQVQVVLLGHEQRLGLIENTIFPQEETVVDGEVPNEGDSGSANNGVEDAGQEGTVISVDFTPDSNGSGDAS